MDQFCIFFRVGCYHVQILFLYLNKLVVLGLCIQHSTLTSCWLLWCAMNKLCLANEVVTSYTLKLVIVNYSNLLAKHFLKHNISHLTRNITQNAHKDSNTILNVDGSNLGNFSVLDFCGLIWNVDGEWVHDFTNNIGYSNILYVELMKIDHGLRITWELGIKDLMRYFDFNSAIKFISESVNV